MTSILWSKMAAPSPAITTWFQPRRREECILLCSKDISLSSYPLGSYATSAHNPTRTYTYAHPSLQERLRNIVLSWKTTYWAKTSVTTEVKNIGYGGQSEVLPEASLLRGTRKIEKKLCLDYFLKFCQM